MATTFFFESPNTDATDQTPPGNLSADCDSLFILGTRGSASRSSSTSTVNGPTSGIQCKQGSGGSGAALSWWSVPLSAVTISGTITFNIWGNENNMSANAGLQVVIDRVDGSGSFISTIINSEKGTELPTTTAAQNWTGAPTSTTLSDGDRLRVRVYINDGGGTMATGFLGVIAIGATSAGINGDSFVTFTETITEFVAAAERVPRFSPYPQLLAH